MNFLKTHSKLQELVKKIIKNDEVWIKKSKTNIIFLIF